MIYKYYVGIDPGAKGAIAVLQLNTITDKLEVLHLEKLPTYQVWKYIVIDLAKLHETIITVASDANIKDILCLVEKVTSFAQGKKSAFVFGANSLGLVNFLQAIGLQICSISPTTWKPSLGLSKDKNQSISLAKRLFPQIKEGLTHDEAEALLLAFICYKSEKS